MRRTWALLQPTLLLALLAGCSSTIDRDGADPAETAGSSGTTSTGKGGSSNAGSGTGPSAGTGTGGAPNGGTTGSSGSTGESGTPGIAGSPSTEACPTTELPRTPLRRLTRTEYANTVADLLNVDASPVANLPADEVTNGYDNNAGVLTVSALHAEKYVLVSEALADAAVAQRLAELTNSCDTATTGEEACARQFAQSFGRRAFRRAVTPQDEQTLLTAYAAGRNYA
jgi:hypothetical protein